MSTSPKQVLVTSSQRIPARWVAALSSTTTKSFASTRVLYEYSIFGLGFFLVDIPGPVKAVGARADLAVWVLLPDYAFQPSPYKVYGLFA